jgi:hypothetical protein
MTVHSQLTWKLRRIPHAAWPAALRLPLPSEHAFTPMYAQAAVAVLVELTAVIMGLLLVARLLAPAATPFEPYQAFFPGAPKQAVIEQGFACQPGDGAVQTDYCSYHPSSGVVAEIGVWIADEVVYRIIFNFHEGSFRVGDLPGAASLPTPPRRVGIHRLSYELAESALQVAARSESGKYNLLLPLHSVSFAAAR